ncbi:MAG: hypothetical protein WCV85_03485 [Patescibacteria group bacterium]
MKLKLSKELFWDTNVRDIDERKHADFIIGRVLQYGDLNDYKILKGMYSLPRIKKIASKVRYIDKKSKIFWQLILNFSWPSTRKSLLHAPTAFSQR